MKTSLSFQPLFYFFFFVAGVAVLASFFGLAGSFSSLGAASAFAFWQQWLLFPFLP
ncbi:hypothetical protein [Niabella hibiscisoli]|uniref:hypothetical protein n=1 Tax=Niabella hibiscisoli TaxID=1825928 RepID=UPI001F11133D|nr:hypothetical protein [Niabella hibiscisoli]MCH5715743.1 hypothetical protein [Niabella hibiscisoli]